MLERVGAVGLFALCMIALLAWSLGPELAEDRRQRAELDKQFTAVLQTNTEVVESMMLQSQALQALGRRIDAIEQRQNEYGRIVYDLIRPVPPAGQKE